MYNPCIRGWIIYYSHFYRTQLRPTLVRIDAYVIRWARRKFKRMRHRTKGGRDWFDRFRRANHISSPTGYYAMATAEHRERCKSRGSCTVLGAPGGEIPPGNSTMMSRSRIKFAKRPIFVPPIEVVSGYAYDRKFPSAISKRCQIAPWRVRRVCFPEWVRAAATLIGRL